LKQYDVSFFGSGPDSANETPARPQDPCDLARCGCAVYDIHDAERGENGIGAGVLIGDRFRAPYGKCEVAKRKGLGTRTRNGDHLGADVDSEDMAVWADLGTGQERHRTRPGSQVEDSFSRSKLRSAQYAFDDRAEPPIYLPLVDIRHSVPYADLPFETLVSSIGHRIRPPVTP
jgi:hypothetical protein